MTDDSARLGLPYVRAGQLQKHVTVNEALTRLDSLVQTAVASRTASVPPGVVNEGDLFIVGPAPDGAWEGFAPDELVRAEFSGWVRIEPTPGMQVTVLDEQVSLLWLDGAWRGLGEALGGTVRVERLGLGADADAANPFSARVNKALWAALPVAEGGDGDVRFTLNKEGAQNTASLLFQSQWNGCAEIGLTGDDDLRLKVSADGQVWSEAFRVDGENGRVWFTAGAMRQEVVILTADVTVQVPEWARRVEMICIGGGGAGGPGMSGAPATERAGGGGGGAGGVSRAVYPAEALGALEVIVGGGGVSSGADGGSSRIRTLGHTILSAMGGGGGRPGQGGAGGHGTLGQASDGFPTSRPSVAWSAGGGGAGGSVGSADQLEAARAGGTGGTYGVVALGGAAGTAGNGGSGGTPALMSLGWLGGGGGGGAANVAAGGWAGGAAGSFGAGGGGGGAGQTAAGAGGQGAPGLVRLCFAG